MSKPKRIAITLLLLCLTGIAAAVVWVNSGDGPGGGQAVRGGRTAGGGKKAQATPLQQPAAGGLSVAVPSASDNLGQMLPNGNSSSGATASKSTPSPFDPSTYGEYEKYKDGTGALFADVVVGEGTELGANMKAAVYYKGWLTNGQLFDASKPDEKGELGPFVFTLGARQVIPGWEQALAGMKTGGVRLVIVPPAVGYGADGQGPIPANAVLVFQVQLAAVL